MHFYERIKQKFVYIYLFLLARRFFRFLKNFPNVGYDILERGYRCAHRWLPGQVEPDTRKSIFLIIRTGT